MEKNSKGSILTPILLSAALVLGVVIGLFAGRNSVDRRLRSLAGELDSPGGKISYALSLIDRYYVDPVSTDSLVEALMPDLMWYLDPHSVYIPASELAEVNMPLEGEFDGIGITFNMSTDTIIVLNVIPQGPSQKAGVQNGDRIIRIDDSLVAGRKLPMDDVMKMLRGPRGTQVTVSVQRKGIDDLVPIAIVRDKIPVKSVDAAYMLTPDIGFLRITTFSQYTHDEMVRALGELRREGMRKLIIDLRGNTGGSAIRLTTARYYTPTGRSIQKPYTSADSTYGYDIYNRYLHNELFSADSIHFDDSLKFVTPGGKTVYGGGGIMPDLFVPLDTTEMTPYYMEVAGRNILYRYTMEYADRNREKINAVESIAQLDSLLDADTGMFDDFVRYAERNGVAPDRRQIRQSERLLRALLRAYIGRNTPLEETGFYANYYVVDAPVLKALEVFGEPHRE